jgi:hypothetical protein
MKRKLFLVFIIFSLSITGFTNDRFSISVMGNYLSSADEGFQDFYGKSSFYPEVKLGIKIFKGFYLWGGFASLSARGETEPMLQEETKWTQKFFSFGGGYKAKLISAIAANLRLGILFTKYKEEALEMELDDSASGFFASAGLVFHIGSIFFIELEIGYLSVSDEIIYDDIVNSIDLGGFKAGIGIGVRF